MSYHRFKITYDREGPYGSTEQGTIYVEESNSTDYIRLYDENGKQILSFGEWGGERQFWNQLQKLLNIPYHENEEAEGWEVQDYELIHPKTNKSTNES